MTRDELIASLQAIPDNLPVFIPQDDDMVGYYPKPIEVGATEYRIHAKNNGDYEFCERAVCGRPHVRAILCGF